MWAESVGVGSLVGLSLIAGALGAARLRLSASASSALTASGGGLLLAAVAFELVPEADAAAGPAVTAIGLIGGTAAYVAADWWLHREPGMSQMRSASHAAMAGRVPDAPRADAGRALAAGLVIDGIPESIALGLTVAQGEIGLALLAGVVFGNLVEAYGSAHLIGAAATRLFVVIGAGLASLTVLGGTLLADVGDSAMGALQAVAAGAVLAVISITIVPETFRDLQREIAFALIAGFVAGYLLS